jgi:acetyltransferase-like isoleucine patch superfamily enzyme/SAM-dependent methyltransferase
MNFALLTIASPNDVHSQAFSEVAETIHHGLLALGHESVINHEVLPGHRHIVLGTNLLPFVSIELPEDTIFYNLEQISPDSPWVTDAVLALFQRFTLWDYSLRNCEQLRQMGCLHVQHVPLGYIPQLTRMEPLAEEVQDIDVLFYGSLNERRAAVLEALREKGLNVVELFGEYGAERDRAIGRAKIVLNIHMYEAQIFEIVRVSYLLANHKFVLSESSPDDPDAESFKDGVAFADCDQIVEACLGFLTNPQERQRIAEEGFQMMTQRPETVFLQEALQNEQTPPGNLVRVDLGCGARKAPGFIGVDVFPAPGVDIVADLSTAFPFADNSVDELRAYDFIEHLPDRLRTMNEIWRVCKDGALVDLFVPSTDGRGAFQDPTHVSFWNVNSFKYFSVEYPYFIELCQCYGFRGAFHLESLKQYESPEQVIHVHALLRAIKDPSVLSVRATLAALPQKPINAIIFPDWEQPEEIIFTELQNTLRELALHPESASIALFIDTSQFPEASEQTPESLVAYIGMNLLFSEEIDISGSGVALGLVECQNLEIWNFLKPKLSYHLVLPHENSTRTLVQNILTIQPAESAGFRDKILLLRFGNRSVSRTWLKEKIKDERIDIGDYSYSNGSVNFYLENPEDKIEVGKFCSIAPNVTIFGGGEHFTQRATAYPFNFLFLQDPSITHNPDARTKGVTRIGNDVWIGQSAIILSGVTVGDGAIIGAGAVVSRDVPPYAIVAGNPAQIVRHRFSPSTIEFLLNLQWWDWPLEKILLNLDLLYQDPDQWSESINFK